MERRDGGACVLTKAGTVGIVGDRCDSQMESQQSERLSELLNKQQAGTLTASELPELWACCPVSTLAV